MDGERPNLLWTPEIARRTKGEVIQEDWKATGTAEAWKKYWACLDSPAPADLKTWTTLKPRTSTTFQQVFHQASSSPPIPSMQEILDATTKNCLHANNGLHFVCKLGDTVIKYSGDENVIEEAENLLFLAEARPELRIPTVLAVWSTTESGTAKVYCLMMNLIDGIMMSHEKFAQLPIHAQDTICTKISSQLSYLRALPSEGYYGRPHGLGWLCPPPALSSNTSTSQTVVGPYKTYEEFCAAVYRSWQVSSAIASGGMEWGKGHMEMSAKWQAIFPDWEPCEPKLTWLDPKIANVVAKQIEKEDGSEDWEVYLIDWECMGWYPAWVQALQVHSRFYIMLREPGKPYETYPYRKEEIPKMLIEGLGEAPDQERLEIIEDEQWCFF